VRSTAELYDWELEHLHHRIDQDVGFYLDVAQRVGGPVLELACGTGRIAAHLPDVVGLDLDATMLAAARARGVERVVQGDMQRFAFAAPFSLITVPYNSLQLLPSHEAVVDCLRCAAAHLAPGGLVAFEATDFAAHHDVAPELLAEADGVRLTGSLRIDGPALHYARSFEEDGARHDDVLTLLRSGASSAGEWVQSAGLRLVSTEWSGLGLRVVAQR
jgi:SAM-dependent methyltransferase